MEKITKKKFIEEMEKSSTYFKYVPSLPFNDMKDFQSFVKNDSEKMLSFLAEKLKYNDFLNNLKISQSENPRKVVSVKSDGSLQFDTGSYLEMKSFGKKSFFKHTRPDGKSCLCCVSVWGDDISQNIQCLSYIISNKLYV